MMLWRGALLPTISAAVYRIAVGVATALRLLTHRFGRGLQLDGGTVYSLSLRHLLSSRSYAAAQPRSSGGGRRAPVVMIERHTPHSAFMSDPPESKSLYGTGCTVRYWLYSTGCTVLAGTVLAVQYWLWYSTAWLGDQT